MSDTWLIAAVYGLFLLFACRLPWLLSLKEYPPNIRREPEGHEGRWRGIAGRGTVQAVRDFGGNGRPSWAADTGLMSLVLMVRFHGVPVDPPPVAHPFFDRNNPAQGALDLLRSPATGGAGAA
jgi:hypothetical protein